MKQTKRFVLAMLVALASNMSAFAYDFAAGGIYYDVHSDGVTCEVTFKNNNYNSYSGNVEIPSTVSNGGKTYSVTAVGGWAFMSSVNLLSVKLPNTVTSIGYGAFSNCDGLESVDLGNSLLTINGYAFNNCSSLSSIDIPNSVTLIDNYAFNGCESLVSVELSSNITRICACTFYGCSSLESVVIPSSVAEISYRAFQYCGKLKMIVSKRVTPPAIEYVNTFNGVSSDCIVLVPAGSSAAYKAANGWKNLTIMVEPTTLLDKSAFTNSVEELYYSITYERTFNNTAYQPLYVPFESNVSAWNAKGLKVYEIEAFHDDATNDDPNEELDVTEIKAGTVSANKILFVKADKTGKRAITVEKEKLKTAAETTLTKKLCNGVTATFHANYVPQNAGTDWYMMSDGELCLPANASVELGGFRWYVTLNGSPERIKHMARIRINLIDDDETGIRNVNADIRNDGKIYTIGGRLVDGNNLPSGIYIKNGKKFVVK